MAGFRKFNPGDPIGSIAADDWNAAMDAAADFAGRRGGDNPGDGGDPEDGGVVLVQNNADDDAPIGACFKLGDALQVDNLIAISGDQPDDNLGRLYAIALESIASGDLGRCALTIPSRAYYLKSDGTPALGESWGPEANEWYLRKNRSGFIILGNPNDELETDLASVRPEPILNLIGKVGSDVASLATGTVTIWAGAAGSEAATSLQIVGVQNLTSVTCKATKFLKLTCINGAWYMEPWSC